jgi:acyl-CoA thioesterase FadM
VDAPLVITASVTKNRKKLIETSASIFLRDGTVVAEGTAKQFVVRNESGHGGKSQESPR